MCSLSVRFGLIWFFKKIISFSHLNVYPTRPATRPDPTQNFGSVRFGLAGSADRRVILNSPKPNPTKIFKVNKLVILVLDFFVKRSHNQFLVYPPPFFTPTQVRELMSCPCQMKTYLQSITVRLEEWRLKRRDTEEWMKHRQLPQGLQDRVRRFVQYKWLTTRGVDEESILRALPTDLRRDIQRHLCLDLVRRVRYVSVYLRFSNTSFQSAGLLDAVVPIIKMAFMG